MLQTIRDSGPISRAELARATGLSKPTVTGAVDVLLGRGYVTEDADEEDGLRPRRPGRRGRLLRFASSLGHVLGVDIGANKVLVLVADLDGQVHAVERRRTGPGERSDPEALLGLVGEAAEAALRASEVPHGNLQAVGVGTPGVIDPVSGRVTLAPQLAGWEGIQLAARLESVFSCPVLVDNEVRLSLVAEQWRGAARGIEDAFLLHIGVGIGGGILLRGEVYRGANGAAGEIGYLPLPDGDGRTDGLGPFEHAAGGTAFARLARRAAEAAGGATALLDLAGGDPTAIDAETVFAAAAAGDATATAVLDELLDRLARGIAAVIVVLDPSTVIVGGGVSRAGWALLEPLERRIRSLVPVPPRVVLSRLGDEAVALGGVRNALHEVDQRLFDFGAGGWEQP